MSTILARIIQQYFTINIPIYLILTFYIRIRVEYHVINNYMIYGLPPQ